MVLDSPAVRVSAARAPAVPAPRLLFIDNIRWTMILLVLSMHASDTYSPFGNWYYTDRAPAGIGTAIAFGLYQSFLQAFFMALLFFIAGYFAAASLARKGRFRFVADRCVRLGLPTLLYMLVIGPLTQFYLSHTWGSGTFLHEWVTHLADGEWLSNTGPMWFCAALLLFCAVYAATAKCIGKAGTAAPVPGYGAIAAFVVVMAAATFAIRLWFAESVSVLNMHPGDFPQYVLMFGAGTLAWRHGWLDAMTDRMARRIWSACLLLALPLTALMLLLALKRWGSLDGGWNFASAVKSAWESLICVGMAFGLTALYRGRWNAQGAFAKFMSDNAFAVYLIHPPVIIALALALHGVAAPALLKAAVLTGLAVVATFSVSSLVVRRIPGLRQIL
jgi:fucose 4-O-acetylase-like acetyltransferase